MHSIYNARLLTVMQLPMIYIYMQEFCSTALTVSCQFGHVEVARILVQNGASVNYQEKVNCDLSMCCVENMIR